MPKYEPLIFNNNKEKDEDSGRDEEKFGSIEIDFNNLNRDDALIILKRMPNKRYSDIIRLRYLELLLNKCMNLKLLIIF